MYSVCKSEMSSLNCANLVRVISSSRENIIAFLLEKISNFGMIEQFATLVQVCTLVWTGRIVLTEEMREPLQRRTLRDASVSMFHSSEVVGHKNPARFTIHAFVVLATV